MVDWGMVFFPGNPLRWLGAICLAVSAGMLVLGETWLKNRMDEETFLYYWLVCIVFTCLTMMIALLDLRAVRLRSRREQGKLIKDTLRTIGWESGEGREDEEEEGQ
jgi:biotin transporter BioY